MLSLRAKLLLGYGGLFFFLAMMAGITLYSNMRHESLQRASMDRGFLDMENLRRAERGVYRLGEIGSAATVSSSVDWKRFNAADAAVRLALQQEIARAGPNGTRTLQDALAAYDHWTARLRDLLKIDNPAQRDALFATDVGPAQRTVLVKIDGALTATILSMQNLSEDARRTAATSYYVAGALAVSGLLFGAFFLRMLARHILTPLRAMILAARQIQRGETPALVQAPSRDDLGQLARTFNEMALTVEKFRDANARRLLRTEAATQLVIDSLPHAVAVLSPEGRIELANSAAEALFALKPGMTLGEMQHKWLVSLVEEAIRTRQRIAPASYDAVLQVFDNSRELFFLPHAIPLLDSSGTLVGINVVLIDATQLRQVDEAKSSLLSSLSHELKTPLTSLQMSIHLLLEDAAPLMNPRQIDLLTTARDDADRLHTLITSLLDKRRKETPAADPQPANPEPANQPSGHL